MVVVSFVSRIYFIKSMMSNTKMDTSGLIRAALVLVCLLSIGTAEDLMMDEESLMMADTSASKSLDIAFLFHVSANVKHNKHLQAFKNFMRGIVEKIDFSSKNVRVSVIVYRMKPKIVFNLEKFKKKEDILKAISNLKMKKFKVGHLINALKDIGVKVFKETEKASVPKVARALVILTDGDTPGDTKNIAKLARTMKEKGTQIFTVGVGLADNAKLHNAAGSRDDTYKPATADDLAAVETEVYKKLAALQLAEARDEKINIVRAAASGQADIAIIYHFSSKTKPESITKYFVPFLSTIITEANAKIANGDIRLAIANYAKRTRNQLFSLNELKTADEMIKKLKSITDKQRSKDADGELVLKDVPAKLFAKAVDRAGVQNIIVMITDEKHTEDEKKFFAEAQKLKSSGYKLITIGLENANAAELRGVASDPADKSSIILKSYAEIASPNAIENIKNAIGVFKGGAPATKPPMPTKTTEVVTGQFNLRGHSAVDIVFVIHFNPQRSDNEFKQLIDYIQSMLNTADIDGGKVRASVVLSPSYKVFDFQGRTSNEGAVEALDGISKNFMRSPKFNLLASLRLLENDILKDESRLKMDVPRAVVIITDTNSQQKMSDIEALTESIENKHGVIYTIGIGLDDKKEMESVASSTENVFTFSDYGELERYGTILRKQISALDTRKQPQPITSRAEPITLPPPKSDCALGRADLVIVVDSSTSVSEGNFKKIISFLKDFVSKADIDSGNVRVGLIMYSTEVYPIFDLNTYTKVADIIKKLDTVDYNFGSTNTAEALEVMRTDLFTPVKGDRADIPNIALVLTDGVSTVNPEETVPNARLAHNDGIHIYTVGIGLSDYRELDGIASPPAKENSFKVASFDDLVHVDDMIFAAACPKEFTFTDPPTTTTTTRPTTTTRTTTTTTTTTTTRPTTTTTRRTTTTPRPTTTTRTTTTTTRRTTTPRTTTTTTRRTTTPRTTTTTTTTTTKPPRIRKTKDTGIDVVFMMDSTVNNQIFGWMKKFVRDFIREADVESGEWRVGGMTFGQRTKTEFNLNRYGFNDEVFAGLDGISNSPSNRDPDVGGAFDYARRTMFTVPNGDRPRARNFVILLTGKEKSLKTEDSYAAAYRLRGIGTDIFTVGLNFRNSEEIDEISSKPLEDFRTLIFNEDSMLELPGLYKYRMENAPPPVLATTTTQAPYVHVPYNGTCNSKGDVIFLLDTSGSVGEDNFYRMKNFTYATISDLPIDNGFFRIGMMTFSDSSRLEFHLKEYDKKQDIFEAIQKMSYMYGYTHTAEALRRVRTEMFTAAGGDRPGYPNLLVVITDGHSNVNHLETIPEAKRIRATGTTIITVAIGVTSNYELREITSPPIDQNLIEVMDFEALYKLSHVIVSPLCSDPDACSRNPCQNNGDCVEGLQSYMCICPPGFYGQNCEKECGPTSDVVIILDSSSSVGPGIFQTLKTYAQRMVDDMHIEDCAINIGVIKYSSAAMIQFNLGTRSEEEVVRRIGEISYTPGSSNMAEAFRVVNTQMFNSRNGDRPDARNIAYLLTDGTVEINRDITPAEIELTIDAGVRIIPLAVAVRDKTEIEFIAQSQKISYIEIEDEENLKLQMDQVLEAVTDRDDRCKPNPCQNGGDCNNEPLGYVCKCKPGFSGVNCEKECNTKADIVFLVDASRYNSGPEFRAIKRFLKDTANRLTFRNDNYRVGIVEYGSYPRLRLDLLEGDNRRVVKAVFGSLRRTEGDPKPAHAIRMASSSLFGKFGDRSEVPNYLVLVSRGFEDESSVEAINDLKSKGTKVIGIGVGLSKSDRLMMESAVSSPASDNAYLTDKAETLDTLAENFLNFFCEAKDACKANPCENGGICENGQKSYACQCKPGYAGKNCEIACNDQADVVFLIDSSGSVGSENFRRIKDYIHDIVDSFNIGPFSTQVGVATFSQHSRAEIYLNSFQDKRKLQAAISGISYEYGNTNTASGIKLVRSSLFSINKGNRPNVPDFLIVITDGMSNVNHEATLPEAELARKQGIHIFAIGVDIADDWELKGIASSPPGNNVFRLNNWEDLGSTSQKLIQDTCRDDNVCLESPCQNGGTCVSGVGEFSCECLPGYVGELCQFNCQENKDIIFILDSSSSVGPRNFALMLKFVSALVTDLTVGGTEHRFALVTYSTEVKTAFSLSRYGTHKDVINAVETTVYTPGSTNTAGGLRQAVNLYQSDLGDRVTAGNIAILLTDGQSNLNYMDTIPAAEDLKGKDAKVITIGIGLKDYAEIKAIASSAGDVYTANDFTDLENIKQQLVEGACKKMLD